MPYISPSPSSASISVSAELAVGMAQGLQKAASAAGIRRPIHPSVFRHMKISAFQRTGSRPDVVINALGWTREFGLAWFQGHRTSLAKLEEASRVLGMEPEIHVRDWKKRVFNGLREFLLGY